MWLLNLPSLRVENDVTWPLELPPDDDAAMTTVETTDLDSVETGVDEVEVVGHPVDGQARDALQPGVDDHLTSSDNTTSSFGVQDIFNVGNWIIISKLPLHCIACINNTFSLFRESAKIHN